MEEIALESLLDVLSRLANRDGARSEATVQADVRGLLLNAPLQLSDEDLRDVVLESPLGDRRRIDVEIGSTVIEVKRDLRPSGIADEAIRQLQGYVEARQKEMGRRYVGVLTDGAEWRCYHLGSDGLAEVSRIGARPSKPDLDELLAWLEGVLATTQRVRPIPSEIATRLGAGSSAHALDRASLADLYSRYGNHPSVAIKRQLWARLLTTALGSQFKDTDELFVEHTLLVNTAEIVAHAVLGLEIALIPPASLLSGAKFAEHGLHGVVEPDFFDWVMDIPGGDVFIRTLARRLGRFDWHAVEHDVLKVLYESVIGTETRKKLGEYYTPDWLAEKMVEESIPDPLHQRVVDPACGSGTFLFHAVRRYLAAAEDGGSSLQEILEGVSHHVMGIDLHPVAVTLARVTYVLAIGAERLRSPDRPPIQIPVYLGDSMQWQQKSFELYTAGYLVIKVESESNLFLLELRFPESLLEDARRFDELVEELAQKATSRTSGSAVPPLRSTFQRFAIPEAVQGDIEATFQTMCRLHDDGRNHIWGYYVRNLARPLWLAQPGNRADVLIGNPPWLAYRHMPSELQRKFREMSEARGLWKGAKVATHQDLSGLFVARVVQLYLKRGGRFAFVMPNAALDRGQFSGFRKADYSLRTEEIVRVAFEAPWDLRRIRPHFFPRGSAVVFGERVENDVKEMPTTAWVYAGRLEPDTSSWEQAKTLLARHTRRLHSTDDEAESPYRKRFRQGATVVPRVLFLVERRSSGPLGLPAGTAAVRSVRSAYEKKPWKELDPLEGVVETEFVFPLYLGEHVLPYRTLTPAEAVLPWQAGDLLSGHGSRIDSFPRLANWWHKAEETWLEHRSSQRLTLAEQLDYHGKLSAQFPIQSQKILYAASGMHLTASRLDASRRHVIEHSLYWATAECADEALFLEAILNSAQVTQLVRPLMSYGKDERHIDKHVWRLPIPEFDRNDSLHLQLARLAAAVEEKVRNLPLDPTKNFIALRRQVRSFLSADPTQLEIEELVFELLS